MSGIYPIASRERALVTAPERPRDAPERLLLAEAPRGQDRKVIDVLRSLLDRDLDARMRQRTMRWLDAALRPRIERFATRRLPDRDDAHDATQGALQAILSRATTCGALTGPRTRESARSAWCWIWTIVQREVCSVARQGALREWVPLECAPAGSTGADTGDAGAFAAALRDAMDTIARVVQGAEGSARERASVRQAEVGADESAVRGNIEAWFRVRCAGVATEHASPEPGDGRRSRAQVQARTSQRVARGARAVALGATIAATRAGDAVHRGWLLALAEAATGARRTRDGAKPGGGPQGACSDCVELVARGQ